MKNIFYIKSSLNDTVYIYIISDEEVKDGDYGVCLNLVKEGYTSELSVFKMDVEQRESMELLGGRKKAEVMRVLLTNNPFLIKKGLPKIDDKDIEKIITTPKLEYVNVEIDYQKWRESYNLPLHQCYKLNFENEKTQVSEELFTSDITPEQEVLSKIKFVLSAKNDAQALRLIEQYGFWRQEKATYKSHLQNFINQFEDGNELQELSNNDWTVSDFLNWLKLNDFEIIKK